MRKRTMFWGIFILALALVTLPFVWHSSASPTPQQQKPSISMPNALTGQVGVAFNTNLYLTGTGYPLPTLSVTPASQNGISVATNNLGSTGISSYAANVKVTGTPLAAGTYTFDVKATNSKGSDTERLTITIAPAPIAVTGVSVSPSPAPAMPPGDTIYLTATLTPSNATNQVVTWSSSNNAVATVDPSGLVTAVTDGTATITATTQDGGKTDTSLITVTTGIVPVAVASINVTPTTVNLTVGETHTLNVQFNPVDATNQNVTWSSDAPGVVSVAADGTIVGLTVGEAHITATSQADPSKTSSSHVIVKGRDVAVSGVSISPNTLNLYTGATAYLSATITPLNATNQAVTWTSDAPGVADVDVNGLVTTYTAGTVHITVTTADGGYTDTATITVTDEPIMIPVSGITLTPSAVTLNVAEVRSLVATISPSNATNQAVTWSSSNLGVATIAQDGTLTAVSAGTTTITVTSVADGTKTATCAVTVLADPGPIEPNSITLVPTAATIQVTESLLISYDIAPSNSHNKMVTWSSSNPGVATVDSTGFVTGASIGTTTITATTQHGNKTATCDITVIAYTAPNILVSSIAANPKTLTLYVNDSAIVNALITPSNASNQQVAWSSGSPLVASVAADGTVIALSPGVTTVTVTAQDGSNKTDTCIVTVLSRAVTGITLSPSSMNVTVGYTQTFAPSISPSNATNKNLIWGSSNPLVVTVDENGHITAIASGTATVTVTTEDGGKQASCTITVTAPGAIPVYALQVVPSEWEMYPGDQKLLGVIFFPDSATNKGLAWASSNPAAATVDANGLVTAVATGYAEITATAADNPAKTSTCGIAVLSGINPTNGVSGVDLLAPAMGNLAAGQTRKFLAEINPPNADVQGVTWTSNNPAVATVDSTGLVTIIGPGTVTITVDTNDGHYTDSVTFTVPGGGGGGGTTNVPVVRVDLTQTNASIQEGQTFALFYNLYPSNATNKKIVWTNSSPDILSFAVLSEDVGLGGILVKGIHAGQSRITVTTQDGQKTASCLFTVGPGGNLIPVTSVSVSPTTLALATGESKQLTATVLPADATNKNVIWRSSNPLIAIVSANGTVSGVSGGTVTITAVTEDSARTATSTVVVGGGSGGSSGCNSGFSLLVLAAGLPLVIRKRRN